MIKGKRIVVVLPAYNAEKTLEVTIGEVPELVDACILVDDYPKDGTVELAQKLGLHVFVHGRNYGYGRNQQTCYREALSEGADVVIMLHPRLSVHTTSDYGHGEHGGLRRLRRCSGISHHRRDRAARRYAALQVCVQPVADRV